MKAGECGIHRLVADVALRAEGRVLMVRYKDTSNYDGQGGWFLPDDLIAHLEHPDDAAKRILNEQVGLSTPGPRLHHIESFDGEGAPWHLIFHYASELDRIPRLRSGGNLAAAEWFDLRRLPPPAEVAHHGWALGIIGKISKAK